MVNVSVNNQQAAYTYLGKGFPLLRLIKLSKGEDGSGTCYIEVPECKENYLLRHSGDNTLNITLRAITKLMEGYYKLASNHNCTTDQPLKSFVLTVEDKPEPTKVTTVKTDSGPTEQVFSGKPKVTQATTVTTSTGSQGKPNATQVPTITGSGSKEPVPEGSTNYVVIIGVVFAVIIVAILIVFLVVVYVHRMHLLEY